MILRFTVDPRDVPPQKAARRLGLTLQAFNQIREELLARGFPAPDPTTGHYDLVAINAWMDARSHISRSGDLTIPSAPRNAQEVFGDRARRLLNGQ